MPTTPENDAFIHKTEVPPSVPQNTLIQYTFAERDVAKSTEEVHAYYMPYSERTFWTDFRVGAFNAIGILQTDNILVQTTLCTSDNETIIVVPWRECPPHKWLSTRWAIPSLSFAEGVGVWIEIKDIQPNQPNQSPRTYRVELQGFQEMYPHSDQYLLIDENDRRCFLFKQHRPVPVCEEHLQQRDGSSFASIYDMYDGDQIPTHAIDPAEIDGITLFPLWNYVGRFRNKWNS